VPRNAGPLGDFGPVLAAVPGDTDPKNYPGRTCVVNEIPFIFTNGKWAPLAVGTGFPAAGTDWAPLTLAAGYTPYGGVFNTPSYRRDALGRVLLRGQISTSQPQQGYNGAAFATIPVGFRPASTEILDTQNSNQAARVDAWPDGRLVYTGGPTVTNGNLSLDDLSYDAAGFALTSLPVSVVGWTTLPLSSGWTPSPTNPPAYSKDAAGNVYLRGFATATSAKTGGATLGTLPAGFRPDQPVIASALYDTGVTRTDVAVSGAVQIGPNMAANGWISLDGYTFTVAGGPYAVGLPVLPQMRVTRTSTFSLPHGGITGIPWQAAVYDMGATAGQWDGGGAFICRLPGLYRFSAQINMGPGATVSGTRRLCGMTWTPINGSGAKTIAQTEIGTAANTSAFPGVPASTEMRLNVGDTVYVWAYQDSGVAMGVDSNSWFTASYVSA
jgi:hypothetical protein